MSKPNSTLTQERLREVLHYDPQTGVFIWAVNLSNRVKVGAIAGSRHCRGYLTACVFKKHYLLHRLAWLYAHGEMPAKAQDIDHINGIRTDNRIENLRLATRSENNQNRQKASWRSKTGHMGVCWSKQNKKWNAQIQVNMKQISLGHFDRIEDAIAARAAGKLKYHTRGNI